MGRHSAHAPLKSAPFCVRGIVNDGNPDSPSKRSFQPFCTAQLTRVTSWHTDHATCDLRRKDPHARGPKTKNRPLIYAFESRLICKIRDLMCCSAGCRAVLTNGNTGHVPCRAIGFFSFWGAPNWLWWNNFLKQIILLPSQWSTVRETR